MKKKPEQQKTDAVSNVRMGGMGKVTVSTPNPPGDAPRPKTEKPKPAPPGTRILVTACEMLIKAGVDAPSFIENSTVDASYEDGVLTIVLVAPK